MAAYARAFKIFTSSKFDILRKAFNEGKYAEIKVDGTTVIYEPDLPASGFTLSADNGFAMGKEAFSSPAELAKTLLHESFRLEASQVLGKGGSQSQVSKETADAASFADDMAETLITQAAAEVPLSGEDGTGAGVGADG